MLSSTTTPPDRQNHLSARRGTSPRPPGVTRPPRGGSQHRPATNQRSAPSSLLQPIGREAFRGPGPGRGARAGAELWRSGRWDPRAPAELRPSGRGAAWPGPAQRGGRGDVEPGRAASLLEGGRGASVATRETRPKVGAATSAERGERNAVPGVPRGRVAEAGAGRGAPEEAPG